MQKRVLAINDISCIGRCSLTAALPIISSFGVNTTVLPTSILSTQTGGIDDYTYHDLSGDIPGILSHWKKLGISFDAIYTGFLGSSEQVDMMLGLFSAFPDAFKLVDPVMGDAGSLYSSFPMDFPQHMKKLCEKADLITPNMTEAALLLDEEYIKPPYTCDYAEALAERLYARYGAKVIITGMHFSYTEDILGRKTDFLGALLFDGKDYEYALSEHIPGFFHGTGDVFASTLMGAFMQGEELGKALHTALDFTYRSIEKTVELGQDPRFGLAFEYFLSENGKDLV